MTRCLHLLAGPTAVGKTSLALAWAQTHGAEILSCDSLLVYRGMDIGTAKPTRVEQSRVPHHGIDLVPVRQQYSVRDYLDYALATCEALAAVGKPILVTGGSGFYLKGFFAAVTDEVPIPGAVTAEVRHLEAKSGLEGLLLRLRAVSPEGIELVDTLNPRRVSKALERCLATGKSIRELRREHKNRPCLFEGWERKLCLLQRDREALRERVAARTNVMLESGLVEEVRRLRGEGLEQNPSAAGAIGYAETLQWLDGRLEDGCDHGALATAINNKTMALVRKQETWFRSQLPAARMVYLDDDAVVEPIDLFPEF